MSIELRVIGFREDFLQFKGILLEHREPIIEDATGHGFSFKSNQNPFSLVVKYKDNVYHALTKYKGVTIGGGRFKDLETLFDTFDAKALLEELDIEKVLEISDEQEKEQEESEDEITPLDVSKLGASIAHKVLEGTEIIATKNQNYSLIFKEDKLSVRIKQDTLPGYIIDILSTETGRTVFSVREIGDTATEATLKFFAHADYAVIAKNINKDFDYYEAVELAAHYALQDNKFLDDVKARAKEIHDEKRD